MSFRRPERPAVYPANAPHAVRIVGKKDIQALMIYGPAGYERDYVRRSELSAEERRDPDVMRRLRLEAAVHRHR